MTPGEFLGVRKRTKTVGESELSYAVSASFSDGALCAPSCQRKALAVQERLLALKFIFVQAAVTATDAGFFDSFDERPPQAD